MKNGEFKTKKGECEIKNFEREIKNGEILIKKGECEIKNFEREIEKCER